MSIKTCLFDLDGTLINTNDLIISSFLHTLDHYYPGQYKRKDVLPFIGPPLYETFENLDQDLSEEMVGMYRDHNLTNHDAMVTAFAGVQETVEALDRQGIKLGVVTTKMKDTAYRGLEIMGLRSFFPVVIALDDVNRAKPDPEPVLLAMEKLQASPAETIMIGDNSHDIEAGQRAGVKTACVSWSIKDHEFLKALKPDYWLEHMSDLLPLTEDDE
ncbi:pyrophosphatase PpaX [Bacillaceae bacterium SIJ1]|uniref:pyrophosphatase PpaX n=1 Tax=Litoribacterium kuwaitense TaxID=1398745 RepID=UPI0013ECC28B|nr:pyrophosphatase PpaX [Litoribacterium kuwaitense]NGP45340.1 pyrophosphatase PpaX [Litoribacterium kuwaitense]